MKFQIAHEAKGRMRIHVIQGKMSCEQADTLFYYLNNQEKIQSIKVYERTADVTICYKGERAQLICMLRQFRYENVSVPTGLIENSGRKLNNIYQEKLIGKVIFYYARKLVLPYPVRLCYTAVCAVKYVWKGIHSLVKGKIEVPVLDAMAIGISILRNEVNTAASIMFLLGVGEILEEWTHKKSVGDLARTMLLNVNKVWLIQEGQQVLVSAAEVEAGDRVVVHMGNVIPFDGIVTDGEAMINQAALTGESVPVHKTKDSYVYAGTVVEEGEITVLVKQAGGTGRFDKIVTLIEKSEKLKSGLESKAEHLADRLVPYSLGGTVLTCFLTKNSTKALSVLMVDFSCALKLAMPLSVLSAIREARLYDLTVKGGKYLEAVSEADTIVFDKTGTLTKAKPTVVRTISFNENSSSDILRLAACMEEHFPHSMAKAVVEAAANQHLEHKEMHSKVEYIVAHGIATTIDGKRAIIGSGHFVFEDEKCKIPDGKEKIFEQIPKEYSQLYLAVENELAGVILIEDPLREEAVTVVDSLRKAGFSKIVMMTGDSERAAAAIAKKAGIDEYYSEVLPEDKADFIEKTKAKGHKVIMIGDGINDSPALSVADVGIAISDGAEIAREIADITVGSDNLSQIVTLKLLSDHLMKRIHKNYHFIVGFNTLLIILGIGGVIQPTTSALLHNGSTLAISLKNMQNLLVEKEA
ncbi:MAG: heavy metal translocating P-type ATPase [Clostridiales bacterium]|nr:heavy metal translocating P-type ATPase [Clostridiales bacterium]